MTDSRFFVAPNGDLCLKDATCKVVRKEYSKHFGEITKPREVAATLRAGEYAWPGGYPLFFITSDGAALSFKAVREDWYNVCWAVSNQCDDGWRVVGVGVDYGETPIYCDQTGEVIG